MKGAIRFALLTGVTNASNNSIFSDWNIFHDISRSIPYFDICGISDREIHDNLEGEIHNLASATKLTYDEACAELKDCCGGYYFAKHTKDIYNPYSFLRTLESKEFKDYWCQATKTFPYVAKLLGQKSAFGRYYDLESIADVDTCERLVYILYGDQDPISLMYYSGWLTIKEYRDEPQGACRLDYPNRRVKESLFRYLLSRSIDSTHT